MMILLPLALAFADKVPQKCSEGFNCWQRECVGIGPGTQELRPCATSRCFNGSKEIAIKRGRDGRLQCGDPKARRR